MLQTQQKTFDAPKESPELDPSRVEWARLHLISLTKHKFWGSLTLKFEDGKVVHAMKTENLKP
jgi:hypothetical protein